MSAHSLTHHVPTNEQKIQNQQLKYAQKFRIKSQKKRYLKN